MPLIHHTETETGTRSVPRRCDVLPSDTWDLTPLYPNDEEWEQGFKELQADYTKISDFRGKVGESPSTLRDALEFEKSVDMRIERLSHTPLFASPRTLRTMRRFPARPGSTASASESAKRFLSSSPRFRRLPMRPSTAISPTRRLLSG